MFIATQLSGRIIWLTRFEVSASIKKQCFFQIRQKLLRLLKGNISVRSAICPLFHPARVLWWERAEAKVCEHENSVEHQNFVAAWHARSSSGSMITKELVKHPITQSAYWTEVLKRVNVEVKLLAERGLAFRGSEKGFRFSEKWKLHGSARGDCLL